ncbi:hypothetical protein T11_1093 [Trichinella zimbabwensis]|uniref:Uncharacterized protein n=1 Tax=Trichinella zimbabwensis TaxID=268475 RepID=A0A0V1HMZ6_9BILA|nr:hypothetical protein T11_1093 [Trichinella zimbabwensis]
MDRLHLSVPFFYKERGLIHCLDACSVHCEIAKRTSCCFRKQRSFPCMHSNANKSCLFPEDNIWRRTRNSNTSEPLKRRDDRGLCRTPVASAIFSTLTSLVIVFGWPSADICASQKDSK